MPMSDDHNLAARSPVGTAIDGLFKSLPVAGPDWRLYGLLKALPVAIYVTDVEGRVIFYNEAAVTFSGRRPAMASDAWCRALRLFTEDGAPLSYPASPMARALSEDRGIRGVATLVERPDGTRVPFVPYATPLHDGSGHVCGAVNLLLDISEQKRAEETLQRFNEALEQRVSERTHELTEAFRKLQDSENRFRLLVEGVTDYAIYMLDLDGIVTNWNSGAERIKGYRADEILGRHFRTFYTEGDRRAGAPERALATAARDGRFEIEAWRVRKGGERFWAGVVLDAIHDSSGRLIGFAKITRDLTERRAMEEQLRQAQKMEAVGQLTGGIAHDFNNLLGAIVPSLELARLHVRDATALKFIDGAARAADRGAKLTHQLLAFSRRQDLLIGTVDVSALVRELGEMLPRTIGPTMTIRTALPPAPLYAMTDHSQLEAALLNLAINARDAMPLAGGSLTISAAPAEPADVRRIGLPETGSYVLIALADTGSGMTDEVRDRAFDPFFTTKPVGQGTGLGLSMVYGFTRQSGGLATIESAPGRGTTIRLYLPMAEASAVPAGEAGDVATLDAGAPARVLVLDDDEGVRSATSAMLRGFGHEVVELESGEAALALLEHDAGFDLMMVDLLMPTMHGAVFSVRARARAPGVPVLFMTGYDDTQWLGNATSEVVLKKPFRRAELAARLRGMLGPSTAPARASG